MKVRWSETAFNELDDIFAYILDRSPSSARSVAERILSRARFLSDFPFAGHATDLPGIRRIFVVNYPYAVFFEIDSEGGEVIIVSVQHTARKKPATD